MPFDPTQPAPGSPLSSQVMRNQLLALRTEITTIPQGPPGPQGDPGPPGEVTQATLDATIAGTAMNPSNVEPLGFTADSNYDPNQLQTIINKLDDLLAAVKRV